MVDYYVKDNGAAMPLHSGGKGIQLHIDIPDLIGKTSYFVDSSGDALTVPSTGFADNDTVSWLLPKGLVLGKPWAVQVHTAEGGACTAWLGVTGDTDYFFATGEINLNSADTTQEVDQGDEPGYAVVNATTYLVLEFDTAATAVAIFTFACKAFQIEQPA